MKKLILLLFIPLFFACSSDDSIDDSNANPPEPVFINGYELGSEILKIEIDRFRFAACDNPSVDNTVFKCYGNINDKGYSMVLSHELIIVNEEFEEEADYYYLRKNDNDNFVVYKHLITKNCSDGNTVEILTIEEFIGYYSNVSGGYGELYNFDNTELNTQAHDCMGDDFHWSYIDSVFPINEVFLN